MFKVSRPPTFRASFIFRSSPWLCMWNRSAFVVRVTPAISKAKPVSAGTTSSAIGRKAQLTAAVDCAHGDAPDGRPGAGLHAPRSARRRGPAGGLSRSEGPRVLLSGGRYAGLHDAVVRPARSPAGPRGDRPRRRGYLP